MRWLDKRPSPPRNYPARARPGMALADGFFQPLPAQVPPDMLRHQQDLAGPIAQFLTGLFPGRLWRGNGWREDRLGLRHGARSRRSDGWAWSGGGSSSFTPT